MVKLSNYVANYQMETHERLAKKGGAIILSKTIRLIKSHGIWVKETDAKRIELV